MSLRIENIRFLDFRGYSTLELSGLGNLTIFSGPNAVGKTNIVEGVQLLTSGSSFRKPSWNEVVSWGRDAARLEARFTDAKRSVTHVLKVADSKRVYEVNGKKRSVAGVRGTCPAVLFIPDDLQMVKASSSKRRDALDALAAQLSKGYMSVKNEYAQALRQRNLLIREELAQGPLFDSWNDSLVVHGSRLYGNRRRLFERLAAHARDIYRHIVPGEQLELVYLSSWGRFDAEGRQLPDPACIEDVEREGELELAEVEERLSAALGRLRGVELQRHTSLVGPHKDEVAFFIDGRNARLFASQGQQRTIVLVWKLAEVELIREIAEADPVLLLDDVMSELDAAHRDALSWFIEQAAQTFMTTTNLGYFSEQLLNQARVFDVPLPGTRYDYARA